MDSLFDIWKTKIPKYSVGFREKLFDTLTKKFGGSERTKVDLGKHFANNYELYMYAFFLGLYKGEMNAIGGEEKKVDFSHAIQHWGSKANRLDREDFTKLQEFMFMALIAKTEFDILAVDRGDVTPEEAVKALIHTMESYTNGGLTLIYEKLEDNPNFFLQPTAFLDFMTN